MSPRISGVKTRQAILSTGGEVDPDQLPERLELFDQFGNPINLGGSLVGIPTGGATDQVLSKVGGADYDADWVDLPPIPHELPVGGAANRVLTKVSGDDYDVAWVAPAAGGGLLGAANDILEMSWVNAGNPTQVIPTGGSGTGLTFDTEVSDPGGWHAPGAAAFTPTIGGLYQFTAGGWWSTGGNPTDKWMWLRDDTAAAPVFVVVGSHVAAGGPGLPNGYQQNLSGLVRIISGHTYRLMVHQISTVGLLFTSAALKMVRVAA